MKTTPLAHALTILPIVAAAMFASNVQAETASSTIHISTTVVENCVISTTGLSFGTYDPIIANAADPLTGTGLVAVSCTEGTEATLMLMQGEYGKSTRAGETVHVMSEDTGNQISYALYSDAGRTTLWGGTEETGVHYIGTGRSSELVVYGSIDPGQNLPDGSYSAVVLATVNF